MRITNPQNQRGEKLLSSGDFNDVSIKLSKALQGNSIVLTYEDVPDIELWELSRAQVKINNDWCSFLPHATKNEDGSITLEFCETDDVLDFSEVQVILKRSESEGVADELVITIEVKIKRYMGKTLRDSKLEDYDVDANIAGWQALGVEAKTTEPTNYPYADCTNVTQLTAAGFNTGATTIGSDVCLISLDTVNTSMSGTRTFPNVQTFEADLPSLKDGSFMFFNQTNLQTFSGKIPNLTNATYMFRDCTGLTEWNVPLPDSLTNATYMFYGCKLSKSSVQKIADTIPTHTSSSHYITIGVDSTQITQAEQNAFNATIVGKGWTVTWERN